MGSRVNALAVVAHELFGNGLKEVLQSTSEQEPMVTMRVLTDLQSALDFADEDPTSPVRLVVVDMAAPMVSGRTSLDALRKRFPSADIVVAATPQGRTEMLGILGWGVHGLILMTQTADEIRHAIGVVLKGGIFVPQIATAAVPTKLAEPLPAEACVPHLPIIPDLRLSMRQSAVLTLLTEGLSNKAIARKLGLAEATVKVHVNAVYRALNVHNRASAVAAVLAGRMSAPSVLHAAPEGPATYVAKIRAT